MNSQQALQDFINYTKQLKGNETGEAQLFIELLGVVIFDYSHCSNLFIPRTNC